MLIGEWLGSHPPLSKRIWALAPDLEAAQPIASRTPLRATRVAVALIVVVIVGAAAVSAYLPQLGVQGAWASGARPQVDQNAEATVGRDLARLKAFIESERKAGRPLPWDVWDLYARWQAAHPDDQNPTDPFSGYWYDYESHDGAYRIWSTGADGRNQTADDIVLDGGRGATPHPRFPHRQ